MNSKVLEVAYSALPVNLGGNRSFWVFDGVEEWIVIIIDFLSYDRR